MVSHCDTSTPPISRTGWPGPLAGTPATTPQPGRAIDANDTPRAVNACESASSRLAAMLSPTSSTRSARRGPASVVEVVPPGSSAASRTTSSPVRSVSR